jgi:AhpD family alkylhydroperoxidase
MMEKGFGKKIFTARLYFKDLFHLLFNIPMIIGASRNKKITKSFMEKIMTVVTAVNGCIYCTWFHAKQAVSSGISEDEVKDLLNLQFNADASDFETIGLLYAQHYAETNRHPDKEMKEKLVEYYGTKTAKHIDMIIRMIFFGNLSGNTFDAFLSRLKGNKAPNSNIIFEFFFFIFNAPILAPLIPYTKKYKSN